MLSINLLSPSSIIRAELERHIIMSGFLEAALIAAGLELRWEHQGEYYTSNEGFISYRTLGRRLVEVVFVGPLGGAPIEPHTQQEGL